MKKKKNNNIYSKTLDPIDDENGDFFPNEEEYITPRRTGSSHATYNSFDDFDYRSRARSIPNTNQRPVEKTYYGGSYYNNNYRNNYHHGHNEFYGNYGNAYGGWSWGSYSSLLSDNDSEDKENDFIKAQPAYLTPTSSKIDRRLGFQPPEVVDLVRNLSKFFFARAIDDKDYVNDFWKDDAKLDDSQKSYKEEWGKIYDKYWDIKVPGDLPLDKAIYVVKEVFKTQGSEQCSAKVIEQWMEKNELKIDDEIYADPVINELMDSNDFTKYNKLEILDKLSLMKSFGSNFKIEKEIEPIEVYNNTQTHNRNLRNYNELMRLEAYQYALPTFKFNLAKKSLRINHPLKIQEKKQVVIMLVDFSGSMCQLDKQQWVFALIVDRLRYVVKEECELYFSYFLTTRNYSENYQIDGGYLDSSGRGRYGGKSNNNYFKFQHVYNKETAIKFLKGVSSLPNGGDTQLGLIVDRIAKDIEKGILGDLKIDFNEEHYKPELLAIADGQDTVKTHKFSYKTNAISIEGYNAELKKMCLDNKGSYVDIRGNVASLAESTGQSVTESKINLEKYVKIK